MELAEAEQQEAIEDMKLDRDEQKLRINENRRRNKQMCEMMQSQMQMNERMMEMFSKHK